MVHICTITRSDLNKNSKLIDWSRTIGSEGRYELTNTLVMVHICTIMTYNGTYVYHDHNIVTMVHICTMTTIHVTNIFYNGTYMYHDKM